MDWPKSEEILKKLERVKWYIWHGNVYQALDNLEDLEMELSPLAEHYTEIQKLYLKPEEFIGYIRSNQKFIVNYDDRDRNQETISSAFVESTVNEVTSPRFVKNSNCAGLKLEYTAYSRYAPKCWTKNGEPTITAGILQ